jgi:hypothetical protein
MSNPPARRRLQPVLSLPVPAVIPPDWIERIGTVWSLGLHTVAVKQRAEAALEQIAPFGEQVSEALVRAWFAPITLTATNPRPAEQIDGHIAALMLALDGVPLGAFTEATQRDLLRRCTHWPAAAEVYAVLDPLQHARRRGRLPADLGIQSTGLSTFKQGILNRE